MKNTIRMVTEDEIREVFALLSGIPVENIQSNSIEAKRYLKMADELSTTVINQDDAIDTVSRIIKRKKAGIEDPKKPSVLLFAGPTGVGKTHLAKKLTEFLFDDESKIVFLNGAEYSEKTAVNRLSSADPGYIGYGDTTDFEAIRDNPYSVLLIDECEKMHPDIWPLFLRIFEEGELKTSNGKIINFKNCVIILTSNIGSQKALKKNLGFETKNNMKTEEEDRKLNYEEAIKNYFKPEVYNRLSNIVVFNDLNRDNLKDIVELELKPLINNLKKKNIKLFVRKKAQEYFIDNSDDQEGTMGARPIKRSIEKHLNDKLADIILEKGDTLKSITINATKAGLNFSCK